MICYTRQILRTLLVVAGALALSACSKTVQWEEEVSLDTGETILVERTDSYVKKSEPGNPMKQSWAIDRRSYKFVWRGENVFYQTDSMGVLFLQEKNTNGTLVIVDWVEKCEKPGLGEYVWINGRWDLSSDIDKSLINRKRNLMAYYSSVDGVIPKRVSIAFRDKEDNAPNRAKFDHHLDVSRIAINCNGRK